MVLQFVLYIWLREATSVAITMAFVGAIAISPLLALLYPN